MAKITYFLGAGASYYACPILDKQAEMMVELAAYELIEHKRKDSNPKIYSFNESEKILLPNDNQTQVLWHIGYFGKKALEFNTIDTYARKLALQDAKTDLNLLKMSVSVFFDLWENFYQERYRFLYLNMLKEENYKKIDHRYISLFSILLNKENTQLKLNDSFKFISWNYDLQIESTFQQFMDDNQVSNFENLNESHFTFMENDSQDNSIFHLNGHRGFFLDTSTKDKKTYELKYQNDFKGYWNSIDWLYYGTIRNTVDFHKYLKYAWEHNTNNEWFNKIYKVLNETEVLVIIGYSFPPFNRRIDQELFSKLDPNKIKKIVYQDPNANKQLIENLFTNPFPFKDKIEIEKENLNQFYIPNEHFITQETEKIFR